MPDALLNPFPGTFAEAKIAKVAIVDDAYDPPTKIELDEQDWARFLQACDEEPAVFADVFSKQADGDEEIPSFGDLGDADVSRLWNSYTKLKNASAPADKALGAADNLFRRYYSVRSGKLSELSHVEQLARDACGGVDPARFPSTVAPRDLAAFDLVFLDFYLGDEQAGGEQAAEMSMRARQNAIAVITGVMKAGSPSPCPLFVLISSRATAEDVPLFRDEAELLASKFRFMAKPEFKSDRRKTEFILGTLASQKEAANAAELLLRQWSEAVDKAIQDMKTSARRLDVPDYAYIQNYRLTDEKVPLLEYMTWMFNSYLGSLVEHAMSKADPHILDALKSASELPPVLRPMSELPRIYSDITTTQVQTVDHEGRPVKVWTGDLFVRSGLVPTVTNDAKASRQDGPARQAAPSQPEEASAARRTVGENEAGNSADRKLPEKPDVLAVITPVCDLVPGRVKVKSVILAGGTIKEFGHVSKPSNHLIVLDRPGTTKGTAARPHQIDWDPGWPQAFEHQAFDGMSIAGTDYVKVLRLREIYAAELAGSLSGSLGRVGVPVAPPFSLPLSVRVLYRPNGSGKAKALLQFNHEKPQAWEFYSARDKAARRCGIDTDFIWEILEAAKSLQLPEDHPAAPFLTDPEAWRPLTIPFGVDAGKLVTPNPAQKGLRVQRLSEMPSDTVISAGDAHVTVQLVGPLPRNDVRKES